MKSHIPDKIRMKSQSYDYIIGRLRNELEEIRQSEISIDHATNQVKELVKNAKVPFDYEQTAYSFHHSLPFAIFGLGPDVYNLSLSIIRTTFIHY